MSAEAVLRSVHFSTVATVMAGSTTAMLVLEVPLVVPHVLHCRATLETLDPPINVNHSVACSGVKFKERVKNLGAHRQAGFLSGDPRALTFMLSGFHRNDD